MRATSNVRPALLRLGAVSPPRPLPGERLPPDFYARPALPLARALLGQVLVHAAPDGARRAGRIVEVEAYVGPHDLACHASKGGGRPTPRTRVLFGPPGHAYVYLIYGMYPLFNVVADAEGVGAAVLVRGVEPLEGVAAGVRTDGPGRLCRALGLTLAHNALPLQGPALWLEAGGRVAPGRVRTGPRIGVDYAGEWAEAPYRFWVADSPHVSRVPGADTGRRASRRRA